MLNFCQCVIDLKVCECKVAFGERIGRIGWWR